MSLFNSKFERKLYGFQYCGVTVTHVITVALWYQRSPRRWPDYWSKNVGECIIKIYKN